MGSVTASKRSGSANWTVTFGNWRRFQLRTRSVPAIAVGTIAAPDSSASRPSPWRGLPSSPERERPASAYMTTMSSRSRIAWAVLNASSSAWPRRTGNTPPLLNTISSGMVNSWDLAMNWTLRRRYTATKKWSRKEKWFGAMITGPAAGTLCESMQRAR